MNLPADLLDFQRRIRQHAVDAGLDFPEVLFEMLDYDQINEVAAFGGFPTRYPHWRHGMEFESLTQHHRYGLAKIYELVINNDPCYAYLLGSNSAVDNKLVMAHVYGHADFFKNNVWFSKTDRKMMDTMANHATKVRRLIDAQGQDAVEDWLDRCLSIENLVDLHGVFVERDSRAASVLDDDEPAPPDEEFKLRSKGYMDSYINPPDVVASRRRKREVEAEEERRLPGGPQRDIMRFLLDHAPLERWEWELLNLVRQEALYFAPQRATKIMNEGWATYWHRKLMVEHILVDEELIDYADVCAGTLAEGQNLNPYKLGLELYLDIEERWDKGRHGLDYERCDDLARRESWDTGAMAGREQLFLCRRIHNDLTFIDEYLTEEFCHRQKMFVYRWDPQSRRRVIATRDFGAVKEQLLNQLANGGAPIIEAVDRNYRNRGELYLIHQHAGQDLRADWTEATMRHLAKLWKRPVNLETQREGKLVRYGCDDSGELTTRVLADDGEGPA